MNLVFISLLLGLGLCENFYMINGKIQCLKESSSSCISVITGEIDTTTYVGSCPNPEKQYCSFNEKNGIGTCEKKERYPGDKCKKDSQCWGGKCNDGKCKETKDGEQCTSHYECSLKSSCNGATHTCQPLVSPGGECREDENCYIGYICSNQKCVGMASLDIGQPASNRMACKSGFIGSIGGSMMCVTIEIKEDCKWINKAAQCKVQNRAWSVTEDGYLPCEQVPNGRYRCRDQDQYRWNDYVKKWSDKYKKLSKDDLKTRKKNRYTLNNQNVKDAFFEFIYYYKIKHDDECIRNYFYQEFERLYLSSSKIIMTFSSVLLTILNII